MTTNEIVIRASKLVPKNETVVKAYVAFEGDLRIITQDENGHQKRYTVCEDKEITIREM